MVYESDKLYASIMSVGGQVFFQKFRSQGRRIEIIASIFARLQKRRQDK